MLVEEDVLEVVVEEVVVVDVVKEVVVTTITGFGFGLLPELERNGFLSSRKTSSSSRS